MRHLLWSRARVGAFSVVLIVAQASSLAAIAHADSPPGSSRSLSAPSAGASPTVAAQAVPQLIWERISEKDGVVAYRREVPGSPLIAFRGEGVINAPILRVASVLVDNTRSTEWIDSLAEARTLRRISENEFIEYDHVKTPIMM